MDKKSKRRKRGVTVTPTKGEKRELDTVAKYLRKTMKCKEVTVKGEKLELVVGSKIVDALMESEWGGASRRSASGVNELAFPSRVSATAFCDKLLECGYFLRGWRVEVPSSKEKDKAAEASDKSQEGSGKSANLTTSTALVQRKKPKQRDGGVDGDVAEKSDKSLEKKAKKKFKVGFHEREDQFFEDTPDEIYIWQYNPPSWRSTAIGLGLLVLVVVFTMYPLWPHWSRIGAYYVSLGLASLLGVLLLAEVLRVFIFSGIWLATWGKVHFMILPNLYEDVGFWDSFKPGYSLEYKGDDIEEEEDGDGTGSDGEDGDGSDREGDSLRSDEDGKRALASGTVATVSGNVESPMADEEKSISKSSHAIDSNDGVS